MLRLVKRSGMQLGQDVLRKLSCKGGKDCSRKKTWLRQLPLSKSLEVDTRVLIQLLGYSVQVCRRTTKSTDHLDGEEIADIPFFPRLSIMAFLDMTVDEFSERYFFSRIWRASKLQKNSSPIFASLLTFLHIERSMTDFSNTSSSIAIARRARTFIPQSLLSHTNRTNFQVVHPTTISLTSLESSLEPNIQLFQQSHQPVHENLAIRACAAQPTTQQHISNSSSADPSQLGEMPNSASIISKNNLWVSERYRAN